MLIANALAEVKEQLNIASTDATFDADLTTDINFAVKDLYPLAMSEVAPNTSATFESDNRSISIPAGMTLIRKVEIADQSVDFWQHETKIYLLNTFSGTESIRIFGFGRHTITTVPEEIESVIINWAVAKFYLRLAGNRRKYNIYVGNVGAVSNRDMKDSAQFFKEMGDSLLEERSAVRGY